MSEPKITEIPLTALVPDKRNANKGTDRGRQALRHSLETFGAGRSILLAADGTVLAGNKTYEQAAALGHEQVLVVETDGSRLVAVKRTDLESDSDEARSLALADNRVGQLDLDFDPAAIDAALADGIDLSALWTGDELEELLRGLEEPPGLAEGDPDAIPEDVETRCKPGEVWEAGRHKVACLDSTDPETLKRLVGDDAPGMVFADPPYGISVVRGGTVGSEGPFRGRKSGGKFIAPTQYAPIIGDETAETAVAAYLMATAAFPRAVQIWWGGNHYANALPASACWLVWDKQTGTNDFADAELAWTNQGTPVRLFQHTWNGLVKESERGEKRVHPTQKPVALAEWVFTTYGEPGGLIFDPFLGSGMSLIAAERLGHRLYGCELSPEYCSICLTRWETATGRAARRLSP